MLRRALCSIALLIGLCSIAHALGGSGHESLAALNTVSVGSGLSGSGKTSSPLASVVSTYSVTASGTAYSLTASTAAVTFGTTSPSVTLGAAGTYLILTRANVKYNGATFAANQTAKFVLQRTNNTPAYLTDSESNVTTRVITTVTDDLGVVDLKPQIYTTTTASDAISLFANITVTPAAGSVDVNEAGIVAVRLF